jgi:alpha-galactosidase
MAKNTKISIIGAGSGQFSLGIVRDLCLTEGMVGSTVSFMDIDERRLDATHNVAGRFARELGANVTFEKTLDRRECLEGADFVINCAMVQGWWTLEVCWKISRKHGYPQPVWPGSYYQYRLFMDIIRDMEDVCPDAWYIQSANPVLEGCTLITRQSQIKTVGLCHGYLGGKYHLVKALGLDWTKVEVQSYGINHLIWMTKFMVDGQDAYPLLDAWIENKAEEFWASEECTVSHDMGRKAIDVYQRLGIFPVGDTVTPGGGSYLHYYHADRETEARWQEDPEAWFARHIANVSRSVGEFQRVAADPSIRVTDVFPAMRSHETNVSIIDAIANDRPAVFQVNIPNKGSIPSLADDVVVEIPGLVSAAGIQGLHMGDLPVGAMCHVQERVVQMERSLAAYLNADRRLLFEAVLANPWTRTIEQAQGLFDELMAMPANREMDEYYR